MNDQSMPDFIFATEENNGPTETEPRKTAFPLIDTAILSRILRSIGAIIIVVSASTFLFQHWTPGSDLQRFLLLLGFTSVLSLSGLFCGLRLKESKGARTLLGLTLAVTPINFAIMGALLYSQFSWDGTFSQLPGYATWIAANPSAALLAAAGGITVLAPLVHFSFMSLAHNRAKLLSTTFVISNLCLLLPTRQPNFIAGIFILLIAHLSFNEVRHLSSETILSSFEGRLSRGMLWVPALILVGRASYFYTPSQLFISAILTSLALLSFVFLPQLTNKHSWQNFLQICGAVLASSAWINLAELLGRSWHLSDRWAISFLTLPISGLLILLSRYAVGNGNNYHRTAAIIAILGAAFNLLIFANLTSALHCLLISTAVLCYGFLTERRALFVSGVAGTLLGLGYQFKAAIDHFSLTGWGSLMVIGVLIIVSASLLERNSGRLRERVQQLRTNLQRWNN